MNKTLLLVLLSAFISTYAVAQADTVYHYYSKDYREVSRDSADTYMKLYRKDNLWYSKEFYKKTNVLRSEGNFTDKEAKTATGSFKNYKENGTLDNVTEWDDGKAMSRTFYYKNGNKKSWISYNDKGASEQKGWDEAGKEIKNFVVEREARFKGGMEGWKKFMEKHLNANVAADAGAPVGQYPVKVQFIVNKEGYVSNVKAVSIPAACKPCAVEAVSVISNVPQWEPAIQNNEPAIYQAIQFITFQVAEETKKGKKS